MKVNKKHCKTGIDGMNLEYSLSVAGMEKLYLPEESLKNDSGNIIVKIDCVGGKVRAYINAVHSIKPNNVNPLCISDSIKLELIHSQVVDYMKTYLKKHLQKKYSDEYINDLKVTALETNLTLACCNGATPSDVLHLLDMSLDKTILYRKRKGISKCEKANTSCLYCKPKEYRIKVYDKTNEQREKGNLLVENGLLRIEVVFIDKYLKRMYGEKRRLEDVLSKQSIIKLCEAYKDVLINDLIGLYIVPYLNECRKTLFESLTYSTSGHEISDTVTRHRELIVDIEVLRFALKDWYAFRNAKDNSKQIIAMYRKKNLGLPEGTIKTIKLFHNSAG